jgi:hypothetical protein
MTPSLYSVVITYDVGFEVFTAATIKNAIFWDVAPCRSCVNRRFGGTYPLHLQGRKIRQRETTSYLLVPCSQILYPEDGGDTFIWSVSSHKSTWRHIPEDSILHDLRCLSKTSQKVCCTLNMQPQRRKYMCSARFLVWCHVLKIEPSKFLIVP